MRHQTKTDPEAVTECVKQRGTASSLVRWRVVLLLGVAGMASIALTGCGDSGTTPASNDKEMSSADDSDTGGTDGSSTGKPAAQQTPADPEQEVRAALANMLALLEQEQFEEFVHQHAPLDTYVRFLEMLEEGESMPKPKPAEVAPLIEYVKSMQDMTINVHPTGRFAMLSADPDTTPAEKPNVVNPFAGLRQETTTGYGNDLAAAISTARSDLAAGDAEKFATGMFPPSTIAMIKAEGRWDSTLEQLAADAPRAAAVVKDLQVLETLKPVIDGDTATFTLDRIVTKVNRNGGESFKDGERTIRFSLIDGDWRFFDNTRDVASRIDAALDREMPEVEGRSLELRLQKVGSDWRLMTFPVR